MNTKERIDLLETAIETISSNRTITDMRIERMERHIRRLNEELRPEPKKPNAYIAPGTTLCKDCRQQINFMPTHPAKSTHETYYEWLLFMKNNKNPEHE